MYLLKEVGVGSRFLSSVSGRFLGHNKDYTFEFRKCETVSNKIAESFDTSTHQARSTLYGVNVITKKRNDPKPPETTQNQPFPPETGQNETFPH